MTIHKTKYFLIALLLFFSLCVIASETTERRIEIKALSSEIKIGQPLILEIRTISNTPNTNPKTGEIIKSGKLDTLYLVVTLKGQNEEIKYEISPVKLFDSSEKGLEYSGFATILWGELDRIFIFDKIGVYNCFVEHNGKINSNTIEIRILPPSEKEKKAMSIFKDYRDFRFIEFGNNGNQEIISRLEQVVEQCPNALFSKWASARLGLEYFYKFNEEYKSLDKFKEQYLDKGIKVPLFEKAIHYFTIGAELPDEFPIRQNLLWEFAEIEYAGGNYTKVLSIAEELTTKYPSGEYSKRAEKEKDRIRLLVEKDVAQGKIKKPIGVALPIASAAVVGIVIVGLILFLRKKKQEK